MLWVDLAILVIVAVSALISLIRGLIREVLSLISWILALWVALTFSRGLAALFESQITIPSGRLTIAFVVLFVGTLLITGIINFLIGKLVAQTGLTGTDRALGSLFGIARGIAMVLVLVVLAGLTPLPEDPWWVGSIFLGHFESAALWVVNYMPPDVAKYFSYPGR